MKTKLVVVGAAGRMGDRIIALAVESGQFDIVAAVERPDHPDIGKDAGVVAAAGALKIKLAGAYPEIAADVAVLGARFAASTGTPPGTSLDAASPRSRRRR